MNNSTGRAIAITLFAVILAGGIAAVAYNAGAQHAVADGGRAWTVPANAQVVYVRPYGFGFGFFPVILLVFLFFGLMRVLFWRRRAYWHHHYQCRGGRDESGPAEKATV